MIKIPLTPEIETVSRRCVWYKSPEEAVEYPEHFIAHVLTYGWHEDVKALRKVVSDDDLRNAMNNAPAGVFDSRSWSYWQLKLFNRFDPPPMPSREERLAALPDIKPPPSQE